MKLNILPLEPEEEEKEVGPKYCITLEYTIGDANGNYYTDGYFEELTPDIERFIRLLQIIDKNYDKARDINCSVWFLDYDISIFPNPDEDSKFLNEFKLSNGPLIANWEDGDDENDGVYYLGFYINYLDENGNWHDVKIED